MTTTDGVTAVERLQMPGGGFAMLAIDQRESLRTMMAAGLGGDVGDDELVRFKHDAASTLTPHATAVLLDRQYGLRDGRPDIHPDCALILSADTFVQAPGGPVEDSDVDPAITADVVREIRPDALKLLIQWRVGESRNRRDDIVGRFTALAKDAGVPTILEGVVRPASGREWAAFEERDDAIQSAAEEFAAASLDIYKAEVPGLGRLPAEDLQARARALTAALPCPWVVLSSGVPADAFPAAVDAACAGGASGFLAGRAVWADALSHEDTARFLRDHGVGRLQRLADIVRSHQSAT
jgi:sulfofructosephosphate aldolase